VSFQAHVKDGKYKVLCQEALPKLKMHLEAARKVQEKLKS
jgi:hypothetical protein